MKIRGPATVWGKLILIIYVLSIVFSMVALFITIYAIKTWPFVYEWVPSTRELFTHYGILGGAFLQVLLILFYTLAIPLFCVIFLKRFSRSLDTNSFIQNAVVFLLAGLIDGWAASSISSSFLDMYNDILVMHLILNGNIVDVISLDWFHNIIISIWMPAFLIGLFLSFSLRLTRYLRRRANMLKEAKENTQISFDFINAA